MTDLIRPDSCHFGLYPPARWFDWPTNLNSGAKGINGFAL